MELVRAATSWRRPHSTFWSPTEPVNSTSETPAASASPDSDRAQDEPLAGVSWPSTGSSQAGVSTVTAWAGTHSAAALAETTTPFQDPSKSRTDSAASPASNEDTAVSITTTTGSAEMRASMTSPWATSVSPVPASGVPSTAPQHTATLPLLSLLTNPGYRGTVSTEGTSSPLIFSSTTQMARGTTAPLEPPSHTVPPSAGSTAADTAMVATSSSTAQPALGTSSLLTNRLMSTTSTSSSLGGSPAPAGAAVGLSSLGTSPASSYSVADGEGSTSPARPTATWLPRVTVPSSNTVIADEPPSKATTTATTVSGTAETSTARAGFAISKATGTSHALSSATEQPITERQADRRGLSRFGGVDWGDEGAIPTATAVDRLGASAAAHGAAEESTLTVPDNTAAGKSTGLSPAPFLQRATAEPTATTLTTVGKDSTAPQLWRGQSCSRPHLRQQLRQREQEM
ncbi:PREDICTED: mucin-5AC-like [Tinamus guttatus]|uniref:mucin-5AC-like n=1 Tax=Tinamus guttatus TaxID=94827 RepID=UPI00052F309F|nr:PREDICTED: mucin-5AC-like [Tinamus guttatus]